jgi:hypothetical protein
VTALWIMFASGAVVLGGLALVAVLLTKLDNNHRLSSIKLEARLGRRIGIEVRLERCGDHPDVISVAPCGSPRPAEPFGR